MSQPPSSRPSPLPALWLRLLDREPQHRPLWLRWGVAVAVTVLALWLRMQMGTPESGARFATLTLATVLSALFGGVSAGLLSTLLGMTLANFFLITPFGQMAVGDSSEAFWLNVTYLLTQLVILGAIWAMQQRNRRLHELTRQLGDSQRMARNTFEHAAAGITHVGLQGQLLDVNQTFCNLVGYTEDELEHLTFQDITHPDDVGPDVNYIGEALAGRRSHYALEKRYIHKDGHLIWAQLTVALMRKPSGEPDYFISVVQDISGAKATEEALRTSDRLMRQAQGVANFITWEADIATRRFRTFGNTHKGLGLPSTEFGVEQILNSTHPEEHQRIEAEWIAAIKGKNRYHGTYRGHPDLPVRWFQVSASFDRDAQGHTNRAYGVTQDISTRKLAELEIQRLNASLEQRIQERTKELKDAYGELESYSYAVAHDLRSPLRIINGFAQALEEDNTTLSDSSQTHIQRIKASSQKMGLLIDGLLQLAQYARGEVVRKPVNISDIAHRLLQELAHDEPERRVDWAVEPMLTAQADPALVEALLQNLLHNAWKYTAHTEAAQIRVFQEAQGDQIFFCVKDNGAGFDMHHAEKLFQPFQRLHMPHEFTGLGVGLATAQRIVKRHGGELRASGERGKGAQFCFNLPAPSSPD
ncbi:PAS domain S-box protein [Hydrogenophaga crassostreae]|nr:PAS domain S-box protein [Hydrogenophaga crassostreae]